MENVVVQIADPQWTNQAVHLASALARNMNARVTLLYLILVRNPGLLGSQIATPAPTWQEQAQFQGYSTICEDYGVECVLQPMQYVSQLDALQDAASILHARVLFVKRPDNPFSLRNRFWAWYLQRGMQATGCQLYLVDTSTRMIDWIPAYVPTTDFQHPTKAELAD